MSFKFETVTMIPSLILFLMAIYLSFFSFVAADPSMKKLSVWFALCFFVGGVTMAICWALYWVIYRKL